MAPIGLGDTRPDGSTFSHARTGESHGSCRADTGTGQVRGGVGGSVAGAAPHHRTPAACARLQLGGVLRRHGRHLLARDRPRAGHRVRPTRDTRRRPGRHIVLRHVRCHPPGATRRGTDLRPPRRHHRSPAGHARIDRRVQRLHDPHRPTARPRHLGTSGTGRADRPALPRRHLSRRRVHRGHAPRVRALPTRRPRPVRWPADERLRRCVRRRVRARARPSPPAASWCLPSMGVARAVPRRRSGRAGVPPVENTRPGVAAVGGIRGFASGIRRLRRRRGRPTGFRTAGSRAGASVRRHGATSFRFSC